jgi:hypothetical protein
MMMMIKFGVFILLVIILNVREGFASNNNENNIPTVVFGEAARPDGGQNVFVVEQPKNAPNPLGDPIVGPNTPPEVFNEDSDNDNTKNYPSPSNNQWQEAPSVPEPIQNSSPQEEGLFLGKDFQNTLMEANDRIYDVQSYPIEDINVMSNPSEPQTIYSPNVNKD